MEWQPIETAPIRPFDAKNWFEAHSPRVLVVRGGNIHIATYDYTKKGVGRWRTYLGNFFEPTHWMPLPPPPEVA
jgi:hypothetical protein